MCQRLFSLHWKVVFKKLAPDDLKKFGPGVKKKLASGDKSVRRISQEDLGKWGIIMIIVIIIKVIVIIIVIIIEISISNIMILE